VPGVLAPLAAAGRPRQRAGLWAQAAAWLKLRADPFGGSCISTLHGEVYQLGAALRVFL